MARQVIDVSLQSNETVEWMVKDVSPALLGSLIGRPIQLVEYTQRYQRYKYIGDWRQRLHISYPGVIYIDAFETYPKGRIKAWFKDDLIDEDEPYDAYSHDTHAELFETRKCWVCRWFTMYEKWIMRVLSKAEELELMGEETLPSYYRIRGDRHEYNPDDGVDIICRYPVWVNENLISDEDDQGHFGQRLAAKFYRLNDDREDRHPRPSPVEDIVDPDLLICRPPLSYTSATSRRHIYQWIPSKFIVNNRKNEVKIVSPICHLENQDGIYDDVAKVFSKMLPMFKEIKGFPWGDDSVELQVVVKVQSYNIEPGMTYAGRWHTEGQTENILGVGVYYMDVDRRLRHGALKFRPKEASDLPIDDYEVNVHTGAGIVFENSIPHRFRQMKNPTDSSRRRTFINFFVVDPRHPIAVDSSQICLCYSKQLWGLIERQLPDSAKGEILSYMPNLWGSIDEAKRFRHRIRQQMFEQKSGWGWIQFGNSGIVQFTKQTNNDHIELRHTESD